MLFNMIDLGDKGKAGNPFASFDDVIQDLKQMSNNPQIYLYEQGNDFYSANLHLGQGSYGRVK